MEAAMELRKIGDAAARGSWCVQQATAAKLQVAGNTKHRPYAAHRQPLVQTIDFPFPRPFFFNKLACVTCSREEHSKRPFRTGTYNHKVKRSSRSIIDPIIAIANPPTVLSCTPLLPPWKDGTGGVMNRYQYNLRIVVRSRPVHVFLH